jgi:hypothetical protein
MRIIEGKKELGGTSFNLYLQERNYSKSFFSATKAEFLSVTRKMLNISKARG